MGGGKHPLAFLGKKGFHTKNVKNVERVWIAEEKEKAEQKKVEEFKKQLVEERQMLDLRRMQTEAGIRKPTTEKLDWMYEGPMSGTVDEKEQDDYLLGKTYEPKDTKQTVNDQISRYSEQPGSLRAAAVPEKPSATAAFSKMHEDPMMKMRTQELKAREAVVKNPLKMNKVKKEIENQLLAEKRARKERKSAKKEAKKNRKREKKEIKKASKKDRRKRSPSESSSSTLSEHEREEGRMHPKEYAPKEGHPDEEHRSMHRDNRDRGDDARGGNSARESQYGLQNGATARAYSREELGPSAAARAKAKQAEKPAYNSHDRKRQRGQSSRTEEEQQRMIQQMQQDAESHEKSRDRRIQKERAVAAAESSKDAKGGAVGGEDPKFIRELEKVVYDGNIGMEERVKRNRQNHQKELGSDSFMRK